MIIIKKIGIEDADETRSKISFQSAPWLLWFLWRKCWIHILTVDGYFHVIIEFKCGLGCTQLGNNFKQLKGRMLISIIRTVFPFSLAKFSRTAWLISTVNRYSSIAFSRTIFDQKLSFSWDEVTKFKALLSSNYYITADSHFNAQF